MLGLGIWDCALAARGLPYKGFALAADFERSQYWREGVRYPALASMPGYAFTNNTSNTINITPGVGYSVSPSRLDALYVGNPVLGAADRDFIMWVVIEFAAGDPAAAETPLWMKNGGGSETYVRRATDGLLSYSASGAASATADATAGGRAVLGYRRKGGKNSGFFRYAGLNYVTTETTAAYPQPSDFGVGHYYGAGQPTGVIKGAYIRSGAFTDVELDAILSASAPSGSLPTPRLSQASAAGTNPPVDVLSGPRLYDTVEYDWAVAPAYLDGVAQATQTYLGSALLWPTFTGFTTGQQVLRRQRYGRGVYADRLVIEGDSISTNTSATFHANKYAAARSGTVNIVNYAVGGSGIVDLINRQVAARARLPEIIAISTIGTNDLADDVRFPTAQSWIDKLTEYAAFVRASGSKLYVGTIISRAVPGQATANAAHDSKRAIINAWLKGAALGTVIDGVIDYTTEPLISANGAASNTTYWNADGIHPLEAGHDLMLPIFMAAMDAAFALPTPTMIYSNWSNTVSDVIGSGGGAAEPLPEQGNLLYRFSADAIPSQTDATALPSWTDSVSGLTISQPTGANQPKYRTNRTGSKPAVQFEGGQWLEMGRPAALVAAAGNANTTTGYTCVFVVANTVNAGDTRYAPIFAVNGTLNSHWITMSGAREGTEGSYTPNYTPTTGFRVVVVTYHSDRYIQVFTNGTCFGDHGIPGSPGAGDFQLGGALGTDAGRRTCRTDLMDFIVYNKALTWADVMRVTKWGHDKYGQAYPWASAPYFTIFEGDSQSSSGGEAAPYGPAQMSPPAQMMRAKSQSLGWWTNLARGARTAAQMVANGSMLDDMATVIGKPTILCAFEYYNEPSTASQLTWLANRKTANAAYKIAWGTSLDNGWTATTRFTGRPAYNAAFDGNANVNYLVPLHLNALVGVEGACPDGTNGTVSPAGAGNTYFSTDGIHNLNAGRLQVANEFGTAWTALAV